MRFRTYRNTDLKVSEVGFGLWTISTGWWGNFTEGEAIALMHKAFDLGVTLFDAADTYGNGLSEELIAKAFPKQRDEIVIATKVGYDFVTHGETRGRGQREIPQDFSPEAITRATDAALKRLKTDRVDLLQLHNIRMEQVYDDALWTTLERLKASGKIRHYGVALGPAIGWLYEGVNCIRERDITKRAGRSWVAFADFLVYSWCFRMLPNNDQTTVLDDGTGEVFQSMGQFFHRYARDPDSLALVKAG